MSNQIKFKSTDLRNPDFYTAKLLQETTDYGYRWLKVAGVIMDGAGHYLLMHEARRQQFNKEGKEEWVDGDGGWNLPAGRINIGEPVFEATLREIREETGWKVKLTGVCHLGLRTNIENPYSIITFAAQSEAKVNQFRTQETIEVGWFNRKEIHAMEEMNKLRSPHLVITAIDKCEQGIIAPLEIVSAYF